MSDIAENIKRLRKQAGMSQEELAAKIGKTSAAVSQYENGRTVPRMGVIEDMAQIFGVSKSALVESKRDYGVIAESEREQEIADVFRSMTLEKQEQLLRIAKSL